MQNQYGQIAILQNQSVWIVNDQNRSLIKKSGNFIILCCLLIKFQWQSLVIGSPLQRRKCGSVLLVKENKQWTLQRCRAIVYSPESLKNSMLGLKTRQTLWSVSNSNQQLKSKFIFFLKKERKCTKKKMQQFEACYTPFTHQQTQWAFNPWHKGVEFASLDVSGPGFLNSGFMESWASIRGHQRFTGRR